MRKWQWVQNVVSYVCENQEPRGEPITATDNTMKILVKLTEDLPVGTNLALLQFMWMLGSGALLPQAQPRPMLNRIPDKTTKLLMPLRQLRVKNYLHKKGAAFLEVTCE